MTKRASVSAVEQLTTEALEAELKSLRWILRPPPTLTLIEWADQFREVASATSATPGKWRTSAQPCAFGPMKAILESDTHTVSVMSSTQTIKSELLLNVCAFYITQEPAPILFLQPTHNLAAFDHAPHGQGLHRNALCANPRRARQ